jgi:hypothetical protein
MGIIINNTGFGLNIINKESLIMSGFVLERESHWHNKLRYVAYNSKNNNKLSSLKKIALGILNNFNRFLRQGVLPLLVEGFFCCGKLNETCIRTQQNLHKDANNLP